MDKPNNYRDLSAIYEERRKTRDLEIAQYNLVDAAVRGDIPEEFDKLFAETDVKLRLRTIRAADDGLTKFLSEIPVLPHVQPMGKQANSDKARDRAEKAEKIALGWHNGSAMRGGVEFDGITLQLARHQVRFGDGCLLVHPDYDRKLVYLEAKDPRCHFPPQGWSPWSQTPLDGTLLVYETSLGEVKRRFATDSYGDTKTDVMMRLDSAYRFRDADDGLRIKVCIYRSREFWCIAAIGGDADVVLAESQTGDRNHPGVTGVVSLKQFDSDPLFLGQIGIEASLVKVLNQQIQNTERINKAPIIGPPLMGDTLRWGEYNVVDMAMLQQGRIIQPQRMAPDSPNNLTQVMGSLLQLAQMFNYNPESMMGSGDANSGKAIQQLQAGPRALVTNILWSPYKPAFPRAYDDCLEMELNLWPNERKTVTGHKGRKTFDVEYIPSAALEGFKGRIKIEDARTGGYSAFLEAVQKKDAGLTSRRDVMEKDPDVGDVEETIRRIEYEDTEKFINAAFEALGNTDPLTAIRAAAEVNKRVSSGQSKAEAIQGAIEDGFLEPPQPEEAPAAPGGMPPELAALMGGGPMGEMAALPPAGVL